ncbi:MAG: N,N-diacetylchitobiose transport system substrate-binding protein, partial [Actinomycetota bacterium]|nr:N,N-diacetylchitobiose transport system substrate-binding protein [Actinomycetota bacterium]
MGVATALALSACSSSGGSTAPPDSKTPAAAAVKLWLAGADTPDPLRTYLKTEFAKRNPGSTLVIEQQDWSDLVTKLTTTLPDGNNTPDVVELGNTQSPTFTNVGAFLDISPMYKELGGDKLLKSFVKAGAVNGKNFTLPYYFGSRYMFYRTDVWKKAGVAVPTTLAQFNTGVADITAKNPKGIDNFSGFFLGGQDWRDGISWIFANGGDLAKQDGNKWVSSLSDPKSLAGLMQLQAIQAKASNAPADAKDQSPWLYLNDRDSATNDDKSTTPTSLAAATIMAPGWAHFSLGDLTQKDGKPVRTWNDASFGTFVLPGKDGGAAPVLAGGSNIGISAKSKHPELAKSLMKIIFSAKYQAMLGKNGLGPANSDYLSSLGTDQFAKAAVQSASNSKLTPAAPGWAAVEGSGMLEEFFGKVAKG